MNDDYGNICIFEEVYILIFVFIHNKEKHDEDSSLDCPNRDCDDDDDVLKY